MRVLRARGIESEARVPFAGLLELLRPALAALEQIPAPQRSTLEGALALRPATAQDGFAVGAATLNLLAAHAEVAPVAAFVDDAQWLDGSTADALLFATRRLVADPIAVVVAVREGHASFVDAAQLRTLHLGGLDRDAAAALVGDDAVDRLYSATAGNPLALLELAQETTWLADLPIDAPVPIAGSVAQGFVRRAEALPEATQRALLVAAASDTGELHSLEAACPGALQALVPAESAGLVTLRDGCSSSATSWPGRRCTGPRRPRNAARRIARSRGCFRTATPTAARGISRSPPSAPTRLRRPRSSRPEVAHTSGAPTTPRRPPSSVRQLCRWSRPACFIGVPTQPGSPARRSARSRCWTLPSRSPTTSASRSLSNTCADRSRRAAVRFDLHGRSWPTRPSALPPPIRSSRW